MNTKTLYKHIFAIILVFSIASASLVPLFDARADEGSSTDVPLETPDQSVAADPSPSPSSTPEPEPSSDASAGSDAPAQSADNSTQGAFDLVPTQSESGSASTTSSVLPQDGEANAATTDAGIATSTAADSSNATSTASTTPDNTNVSSEQSAEVANAVTGDASSGGNSASNNASSSTISTGDADTGANVANFVNTNIVGGDVVVVSLNATSTEGDIDLRGSVGTTTEATSSCTAQCLGSLTADNANTATTTNDISLSASSGSNTASDNNGDSMVITGDATAAANVINFLNANFVHSQMLFVTLNNLGDFDGDLIFPGKWFFERLWGSDAADNGGLVRQSFSEGGADALGGGGVLDVENDNTAAIRNIVVMEAETGANEAVDNAGDAVISTGGAHAAANILTLANTNLVGGTPIYILLNVGGKWGGTVFSIPNGAEWRVDGGKLVIEKGHASSTPSSSSLPSDTHISNANAVSLVNAIRLSASSGRNRASGNKGNVRIRTGSAFAAANILNVVNTNIIGLNGLFALINISGDWRGNIAFGRPDLWLGSAATVSDQPARVRSTAAYTCTIRNNGDADATNVRLYGTFNTNHLGLEDAGGGIIGDSGGVTWNIGTIPVGGAVTRTLRAYVNNLPIGTTDLAHSFSVSGFETDANTRDNRDSLVILAERERPREPFVVTGSWPPELVIVKNHEGPDEITASSTVHYKISVMNVGMGSAYNAYVIDRVVNAKKKTIDASRWDIGDIYPRQEVIIEYDLEYASTTPAGMYTNYAWAWARGGTAQGYVVGAGPATSTIKVINPAAKTSGHARLSASVGNGSGAASQETGVLAHDGGTVQLSSVHEKLSFSSGTDDQGSVPTTIIHVHKNEPARRILLPSPLGISAKKSSSGGLPQGLSVVGGALAAGGAGFQEFAESSEPFPTSANLFASVMGIPFSHYLWLLPGLIVLFVITVFKWWMRIT